MEGDQEMAETEFIDEQDQDDQLDNQPQPIPQQRKKKLVYEADANKRAQMDRRYQTSEQKKLKEWYTRTRMPTLCMGFRRGNFWIATEVPQLKDFAADPLVQQAFLRHMQTAFIGRSTPQTSNVQEHDQDFVISPDEDFSDYRVSDLRRMVVRAVMSDGRKRPGWGNEPSKPNWWPVDVPFADINNSKSRARLEALIKIMESYSKKDNDDYISGDDGPESPVLPIPVQSTPAATGPCIFNPPVSSPGVASPIYHPSLTSNSHPQVVASSTSYQLATPLRATTSYVRSPPEVSLVDLIKRKFGSESVYCGDTWQSVLQVCSSLGQIQIYQMFRILVKLNEDAEHHTVINADLAKNILECMKTLPWEVNSHLSPHILAHLPKLSAPKFITSENQRRLPERYSSYVDSAIITEMGLEPFYSSGDGNCFYNSLSILMSGHEKDSAIYRLGAAMYGLAHYDHIVEKNAGKFTSSGDVLQWAASVSLTPSHVQEVKDLSVQDVVMKSVEIQVLNALKNFSDIELLQVSFAAGFLNKPITQHCNLPGAGWYNTTEGPPCCFHPGRDGYEEEPFHIIWLPLTGQGHTYNHICPLLPWKCGALDAYWCVFWRGFNHHFGSRNEMVQCLTCSEWYHCVCLGITFDVAKDSTIVDCGCTLPHPYQSRDMSVYSNHAIVQRFFSTKKIESLATELLIDKSIPSLRLALNTETRLVSYRDLLRRLGTGPLRGEAVDALVDRMTTSAMPAIKSYTADMTLQTRLLMDVLLPESIIKYIMEKEDLNYFRACIFYKTCHSS